MNKFAPAFVEEVSRLFPPGDPRLLRGVALHVGCDAGQTPILMARRWPGLRITGIDAGGELEQARRAADSAKVAISLHSILVGTSGTLRIPFENASFDLVSSDTLLHRVPDPLRLLDELARVARPEAAVLAREFWRPPRILRWLAHDRRQSGFSGRELRHLLEQSRLNDGRAQVVRQGFANIAIVRGAR